MAACACVFPFSFIYIYTYTCANKHFAPNCVCLVAKHATLAAHLVEEDIKRDMVRAPISVRGSSSNTYPVLEGAQVPNDSESPWGTGPRAELFESICDPAHVVVNFVAVFSSPLHCGERADPELRDELVSAMPVRREEEPYRNVLLEVHVALLFHPICEEV